MNPWTKVECQTFANTIQLSDEDDWLLRLKLVGGKPRYLFASTETFDDLLQKVKSYIPPTNDEAKGPLNLFLHEEFDDLMGHIIFNVYRSEESPSRAYLVYSSLVVETMMKAHIGNEDRILSSTSKQDFKCCKIKTDDVSDCQHHIPSSLHRIYE
ncbi:hypothetical protein Plhal703r1_c15g0073061 [Plasmopara halstedii]